jgi:hypothetical protein
MTKALVGKNVMLKHNLLRLAKERISLMCLPQSRKEWVMIATTAEPAVRPPNKDGNYLSNSCRYPIIFKKFCQPLDIQSPP